MGRTETRRVIPGSAARLRDGIVDVTIDAARLMGRTAFSDEADTGSS
jgi:hypothetical protein